ncbi:unnamed protein product [Penicillium glandicola]
MAVPASISMMGQVQGKRRRTSQCGKDPVGESNKVVAEIPRPVDGTGAGSVESCQVRQESPPDSPWLDPLPSTLECGLYSDESLMALNSWCVPNEGYLSSEISSTTSTIQPGSLCRSLSCTSAANRTFAMSGDAGSVPESGSLVQRSPSLMAPPLANSTTSPSSQKPQAPAAGGALSGDKMTMSWVSLLCQLRRNRQDATPLDVVMATNRAITQKVGLFLEDLQQQQQSNSIRSDTLDMAVSLAIQYIQSVADCYASASVTLHSKPDSGPRLPMETPSFRFGVFSLEPGDQRELFDHLLLIAVESTISCTRRVCDFLHQSCAAQPFVHDAEESFGRIISQLRDLESRIRNLKLV